MGLPAFWVFWMLWFVYVLWMYFGLFWACFWVLGVGFFPGLGFWHSGLFSSSGFCFVFACALRLDLTWYLICGIGVLQILGVLWWFGGWGCGLD